MRNTWILVADRAHARLFSLDATHDGLQHVEDFWNPEGRMKARELQSDRPPTSHDRFGYSRHAIEPRTTPEQKSAERFAGQLRDVLELGRSTRCYQDLVLIAPPRFLGTLNATLGRKLRASIVLEVPKEMTAADGRSVLSQLPAAVTRTAARAG